MARDKKKMAIEKLSEEIPAGSPDGTEQRTRVYEVFMSLSEDDQNEILRMILSEGGVTRLMSLTQGISTPGALDLILDQVQYYHFFRPVVEEEQL